MEMDFRSGLQNSEAISHESPRTEIKRSKKKRKREKENTDGAKFQVQENDQQKINDLSIVHKTMDVKIEVLSNQIDKSPPIVGYFPSGYDPHKEADQPSPATSPSVRFYRQGPRVNPEKNAIEKNEKGKTSEKMELVVSLNESNIDFVGKSYKGEAEAAQLCTYALGVLDKETQTLKILPIAGNKILRLEPRVRHSNAADKEDLGKVEPSNEKKAQKIMELDLRYGTKKAINRGKKLAALNRVGNPDSKEDLGKIIGDAQVNQGVLESTRAHVARNIPPHNTSAETPQEAYPLDRIIYAGEWDSLNDIFEILHEGEVATDVYPAFVCNRIHKLREIQDEVEKKQRSRILSYITHLIKFKDRHSWGDALFAKGHRFPNVIYKKFMDLFSPERQKLSDEKTDLLISYVLVLTLYADDFQTNLDDIAKDLRMRPVPLRPHFENLGCKISHQNKSMVASLPIPLRFPSPMQKRGGRRRR